MIRISADGYVANGNGSGRNGFTNGDPALETPGTLMDADWANHVQEEIARTIEVFGPTSLDSANKSQLQTLLINLMKGLMPVPSASQGTRTLRILGSELRGAWDGSASASMHLVGGAATLKTNSGVYEKAILLPQAAVVTTVRALVLPGEARSGSSRMSLTLRTRASVATTGTLSAGTSTSIATNTDNAGASLQVITLSSVAHTVDADAMFIAIAAGNTAGDGTHPDVVTVIDVDYTDPGARNLGTYVTP